MWAKEISSFFIRSSFYCQILLKKPNTIYITLSVLSNITYLSSPYQAGLLRCMLLFQIQYQESNIALGLNPPKCFHRKKLFSRAESQIYWEWKSGISGLHKVDAANAGTAACRLFRQHTEREKSKNLDGSSSLFKAVQVDKPLVLFTGSL